MRVLLVRPPVPRNTMGLKHLMICEPLELEYLAAGLPGHRVEIMDLLLERGFKARLRRFRPHVVCTGSYITGVNEVVKLCRTVKRWDPGCRTIVGGVHASCAPGDFADSSVDAIVLGDGTSMMPVLMQHLEQGRPLDAVPGLALPRDGDLTITAKRPYMPDPDSLPFPRRDLTGHLRHRYYYLTHRPVALLKTLWGCWYRCTFCCNWRITEGVPYLRSPESIVRELESIAEDEVYIVDDIFLIQPARLERIAELIREKDIRKRYLVYSRADFIVKNEEIIARWAALGLSAVFVGLEATTNEELDSMAKETDVDVNRRAIRILQRNDIDIYGSLITQPGYGPGDWERLWRFIEETGLYFLNISPMTPLPGTTVWEQQGNELTVSRRAHGLFDLSHVLLPTRVPLKQYYRSLLRLYVRTCLDPRRARRLPLRMRPSLFSPGYLRVWWGAVRILVQMLGAHRHHGRRALRRAEDRGTPWRPQREGGGT